MSRYVESRYEIERERRQELFNQRVRETTRGYLDRYRGVLEDVQNQGLVEYVQSEYAELNRELTRLARLLESDPASARDTSIELGRRIHALPQLARGMRQAVAQAQREAERLSVEKQAKARDEMELAWQEELTNWTDSFAKQLAFNALSEVRVRLMGTDNRTSVEELRTALRAVKHDHERKSQEIRDKESRTAQSGAAEEIMQLCREQMAQVSGVAAERAQVLSATLDDVSSMSLEDISKHLVEVTNELDAAVVDETCRREVVQAVYRALEDAGFVNEKPRLVRDGNSNEVVIHGRRPAGAQAVFKIELSGKLNYKFDHYQGSACKKDIDTVLPRLQSIYGIQLSTDRVLWENPDDKDSDAKPQPGMTREK